MRALAIAVVVFGLYGCGKSNSNDQATEKFTTKDVAASIKLVDRDLIRVCKAGAAFRNGRSVQGIHAKVTEEQQVSLAYTRDDGKQFEYDCVVESNVLRFRMIDEAGPGTGPGAWSGKGSITTFKLNPNSVDLKDDFLDGSSDSETVVI